MPTRQLRQSDNIRNIAFSRQMALLTQTALKILAKKCSFSSPPLYSVAYLLWAPIKEAQRKNFVQVSCQQDRPLFYDTEFDILALGRYNHTVSSTVFSVSSYILGLRQRTAEEME